MSSLFKKISITFFLFMPLFLKGEPLTVEQEREKACLIEQLRTAHGLFGTKSLIRVDKHNRASVKQVLGIPVTKIPSDKALEKRYMQAWRGVIKHSLDEAENLKKRDTFDAGSYESFCVLHGILHGITKHITALTSCDCTVETGDGREYRHDRLETLKFKNAQALREMKKLNNSMHPALGYASKRWDSWTGWAGGIASGIYHNTAVRWSAAGVGLFGLLAVGGDALRWWNGDGSWQFCSTLKEEVVVPAAKICSQALWKSGSVLKGVATSEASRKTFATWCIGAAALSLLIDLALDDKEPEWLVLRGIKLPEKMANLSSASAVKIMGVIIFLGLQLTNKNALYHFLQSVGVNIGSKGGVLGFVEASSFDPSLTTLLGALFTALYASVSVKRVHEYFGEHTGGETFLRGISAIFETMTAASLAAMVVHYIDSSPMA